MFQSALLVLLFPVLYNHTELDSPRIGKIIIEGNLYTEERVILNELNHAGVNVGSTFTQAQLARAAGNLNRRGIFDPEEPPQVFVIEGRGTRGEKHILVRVKETRTGMIGCVGINAYRPTRPQPIEDACRKLIAYSKPFEVDPVYLPNQAEAFPTMWSPLVTKIIIEGNTYTSDRMI